VCAADISLAGAQFDGYRSRCGGFRIAVEHRALVRKQVVPFHVVVVGAGMRAAPPAAAEQRHGEQAIQQKGRSALTRAASCYWEFVHGYYLNFAEYAIPTHSSSSQAAQRVLSSDCD